MRLKSMGLILLLRPSTLNIFHVSCAVPKELERGFTDGSSDWDDVKYPPYEEFEAVETKP